MKIPITLLAALFAAMLLRGQTLRQTVRGEVVDHETHTPLPGATVLLLADSSVIAGTTTTVDGEFRFQNIPVGRWKVKTSFIGYKDRVIDNVLVTSARELILSIALQEVIINLQEIAVTSGRDGDGSHEMALVSDRSFSIEDTQRYPGSRGDPARMASNFAGVQGADDARNDIIIRGNSPQGVLWRMEGINIPNPNHFNIPGTAGGPVSMINSHTLANSDFYTGAFPSEFGNSISGVFDLKLRNGNNEKHQHSGQLGFLGVEVFSEGPLSNARKASYLASYRYSTLAIFDKLGIDIGTNAVPRYQDVFYKLNFPLKGGGRLSFFGMGGNSNVDILISRQKTYDPNIYGENDRDQYFKSRSGVAGVSINHPINPSSFLSVTLATSLENVQAYHELVYRHFINRQYVVDSLLAHLHYRFRQNKISAHFLYSKKLARRTALHVGINADMFDFNFLDSVRNIDPESPKVYEWRTRWNTRDQGVLAQPFIQWKFLLPRQIEVVAGIHSQYFSLSKSFVPVEPRAGIKWSRKENESLSLGVGMHSQIQPTYLYFYGATNGSDGIPLPHNKQVDFSRSLHLVTGYERFVGPELRIKGEIYFQHLYHIPVEKRRSSFSVLNTGAGFTRLFPDTLINEGLGKNYGVELTFEKFFSKGYLFLITASLFESRYQGSDRIWRDTDFNGNYILNLLATKEWFLRKRNILSFGAKVTTAGGRRYGPVDNLASEREREVVWVDAYRNSLQFDPYFRADLRINYRINRPKVSHELALDLVNIFGTKNILKLTYAPNDIEENSNPVRKEHQLGFLPLFYYRIDF